MRIDRRKVVWLYFPYERNDLFMHDECFNKVDMIMAFYHSANCLCPIGCCDCGCEYVYYNPRFDQLEIIYGSDQNKVPTYYEYLGEL